MPSSMSELLSDSLKTMSSEPRIIDEYAETLLVNDCDKKSIAANKSATTQCFAREIALIVFLLT
jgi:hypothetical protein